MEEISCMYWSRSLALRSLATFCVDFLDHPAPFGALLTLKRATSASNSSLRNAAMSCRRMQGSDPSLSSKAVSMGGDMDFGRPPPFGGALVDPKRSRFDRIR